MENTSLNLDAIKDKISSWFSLAMGGGSGKDKPKIVSLGVKKEDYTKALIGLGCSAALALGLVGFAFYQNMNLNDRLGELNNLENYDLQSCK